MPPFTGEGRDLGLGWGEASSRAQLAAIAVAEKAASATRGGPRLKHRARGARPQAQAGARRQASQRQGTQLASTD